MAFSGYCRKISCIIAIHSGDARPCEDSLAAFALDAPAAHLIEDYGVIVPCEDGLVALALDISVQSRGHGGFRRSPLALYMLTVQCKPTQAS